MATPHDEGAALIECPLSTKSPVLVDTGLFYVSTARMPTPEQTSQRWKNLDIASSEEADGTLNLHVTLMEMHTGETFVISASGRGRANSGYWTGALMAAVALLRQQTGQPPVAGTHFEPAKTN